MKYMVDTVRARRIHHIASLSKKIMLICAFVFPIVAVTAILCCNHWIGHLACGITILCGNILIISFLMYVCTVHHTATQYIEFMSGKYHKILGIHLRGASGCNANTDAREAYFTYSDSDGNAQEYILGVVRKSSNQCMDAPLIDITRQIYFT